jgi:hypothetical protein
MKSNCSGAGNWLLSMAGSEGESGFSKGTLNYMKKNAESEKPFTLNKHVKERLDQWENEEKERLRIIDMRQCDAERLGIDRKTRWRMKRKQK